MSTNDFGTCVGRLNGFEFEESGISIKLLQKRVQISAISVKLVPANRQIIVHLDLGFLVKENLCYWTTSQLYSRVKAEFTENMVNNDALDYGEDWDLRDSDFKRMDKQKMRTLLCQELERSVEMIVTGNKEIDEKGALHMRKIHCTTHDHDGMIGLVQLSDQKVDFEFNEESPVEMVKWFLFKFDNRHACREQSVTE
jgi:hypothetical protein